MIYPDMRQLNEARRLIKQYGRFTGQINTVDDHIVCRSAGETNFKAISKSMTDRQTI